MEKELNALVVKKSIGIQASPEKIWDALTNPEITKKYMFDCEAISLWKVGSPLIWIGAKDGKAYVKGEILQIAPEKILQYTVIDTTREDIPSNYTTVTYELSSSDNGPTEVSITQGDFSEVEDGEKRFAECIEGWNKTLEGLKKIVEHKS